VTGTKLPVVVLTGFLGSGKTTLLAHLLGDPGMGETAVIVNELGEVAIDHHLLRRVDERTVVLASGCVCCALRGDLADELVDLLGRRERSEVPAFSRVVVETSGLADPAPVLATLVTHPVVRHHFALETVITTVDVVNGIRHVESEKQALLADRIVLTKGDLADPAPLETRLARANPAATLHRAEFGAIGPDVLLGPLERDPRELELPADARGEHTEGIGSFAVFLAGPVDWTAFGVWLSMLLQARGQDVLRVKGLLDTGGPGPLVVNGVQHVVHPPEHLEAWPDEDRRSRLVFICRGIGREQVEGSLAAFNSAGIAAAL
jgi:G3E family GTPase